MIKKLIFITMCSVFILGCSKEEDKMDNIDTILETNNYIIVDVRSENEYQTGHIKDAINIPYDKIRNSNLDKNKAILVYCQSGTRSKIAYDTLISLGYKVYDLGAFQEIDLPKE